VSQILAQIQIRVTSDGLDGILKEAELRIGTGYSSERISSGLGTDMQFDINVEGSTINTIDIQYLSEELGITS
jgi:hypothetical protein